MLGGERRLVVSTLTVVGDVMEVLPVTVLTEVLS